MIPTTGTSHSININQQDDYSGKAGSQELPGRWATAGRFVTTFFTSVLPGNVQEETQANGKHIPSNSLSVLPIQEYALLALRLIQLSVPTTSYVNTAFKGCIAIETLAGLFPTAAGQTIDVNNSETLSAIGNKTEFPLNGNYRQQGDINAGNVSSIGTEEAPFTGIYDANHFKIDGLKNCLFKKIDKKAVIANGVYINAEVASRDWDGTAVIACRVVGDASLLNNTIENSLVVSDPERHRQSSTGAGAGVIYDGSIKGLDLVNVTTLAQTGGGRYHSCGLAAGHAISATLEDIRANGCVAEGRRPYSRVGIAVGRASWKVNIKHVTGNNCNLTSHGYRSPVGAGVGKTGPRVTIEDVQVNHCKFVSKSRLSPIGIGAGDCMKFSEHEFGATRIERVTARNSILMAEGRSSDVGGALGYGELNEQAVNTVLVGCTLISKGEGSDIGFVAGHLSGSYTQINGAIIANSTISSSGTNSAVGGCVGYVSDRYPNIRGIQLDGVSLKSSGYRAAVGGCVGSVVHDHMDIRGIQINGASLKSSASSSPVGGVVGEAYHDEIDLIDIQIGRSKMASRGDKSHIGLGFGLVKGGGHFIENMTVNDAIVTTQSLKSFTGVAAGFSLNKDPHTINIGLRNTYINGELFDNTPPASTRATRKKTTSLGDRYTTRSGPTISWGDRYTLAPATSQHRIGHTPAALMPVAEPRSGIAPEFVVAGAAGFAALFVVSSWLYGCFKNQRGWALFKAPWTNLVRAGEAVRSYFHSAPAYGQDQSAADAGMSVSYRARQNCDDVILDNADSDALSDAEEHIYCSLDNLAKPPLMVALYEKASRENTKPHYTSVLDNSSAIPQHHENGEEDGSYRVGLPESTGNEDHGNVAGAWVKEESPSNTTLSQSREMVTNTEEDGVYVKMSGVVELDD